MRLTLHSCTKFRLKLVAITAGTMVLAGCQSEVDFTRKPAERVQSARAPVADAPIFVVAQSAAQPLLREVDARIPQQLLRLGTNLSRAACVEKNGRKRCYTARVTGDVTREGPARLKGTAGGLIVEIPASYDFTVRGRGGARALEKRVAGKVLLSAPFDVSVGDDWEPRVRATAGLRVDGGGAIPALARTLDIATPIARKFRSRFANLARTLQDSFDTSSAARSVKTAWRHLHYPISLRKTPDVWLRGDPQSVSFGGIGVYDDTIELRIAVVGKVATFSGERPVPLIAREMPSLDTKPLSDAASHLVIPVDLPYEELSHRILETMRAAGPVRSKASRRLAGFQIESARLFPADGRLGLALKMSSDLDGAWQRLRGTAYVLATPSVNQQTGVLGLKLTALSAPTAAPDLYENGAFIVPERPLVEGFQKGIAVNLKTRFASVLGDINRIIDVPFAKGDRLRGRFEDLRVHSIETRETGLRINLDLVGALSVYPSTPNPAVELERSQSVSTAQ